MFVVPCTLIPRFWCIWDTSAQKPGNGLCRGEGQFSEKNITLFLQGWSSSQSLRTGGHSGILKMTPSHASSKSDVGFVSMTASLDSLHMVDEELADRVSLSNRDYYLPIEKRYVHLQDNLFASKWSSECNLERFSTSAIDLLERPLKYRNLLEFPVKEDTKWQLYHTKTGQLTGYLHYNQRSSTSRCLSSPTRVPTSPWKPAFSANSTYSPSFSPQSKTTVLESSKNDLSPHQRKVKGKGRNRRAAELHPRDESSLGQTYVLNKTIDPVSPSAGTSVKLNPEVPLQTDLLESYPLHDKPPTKENTPPNIDSDTKIRTEERQTDHQGTQDLATTSASLPGEPSHVQTDEAIVVPADERGRELLDMTVELSLQAQAVDVRYNLCMT